MDKIEKVQKILRDLKFDGWLLYYFQHNNPFVLDFLQIDQNAHLTRRFFYWIPKEGAPVKIVHQIEPHTLDHMPGETLIYQRHEKLNECLKKILDHPSVVAMEYSKKNALPYVSKVDAGVVELVESFEVEVVSSAPFLQYFSCEMTQQQYEMHKEAAVFLDQLVEKTFLFLQKHLKEKKNITEYQTQLFVKDQMHQAGFVSEFSPSVAFGVNTADPHYSPSKQTSASLTKESLILLDFVCKKKEKGSVYADITRLGFSGEKVPENILNSFRLIRKAQDETFAFIQKELSSKIQVKGCEADRVCRKVIEEAKLGEFFSHRTGHNIFESVHGPGAHLDAFETVDDRPLISSTCFTIEPGLYFPNQYGVRVEYDVFIHVDGKAEITSGVQNEIFLFD